MKAFAELSTGSFYDVVINSSALTGLVMSGASLGAVITYPFLLFYANSMSKKDEILLAAFFFFIGALCESVSGSLDWMYATGLVLLMFGRVIYGAGIACSFHAIPQFIIETVPPEGRGQFGSATEAMTMTGMTIGFGIGTVYSADGWVLTYLVAYLTAVVMGACSLFLPNSPVWLIEHQYDDEEVLHSLSFVFPHATLGTVEVLKRRFALDHVRRLELENRIAHSKSRGIARKVLKWIGINEKTAPELMLLLLDRTLRRSLLVCLFLYSMAIMSGQLPLIYYASDMFEEFFPESTELCVVGFILVKTVVAFLMIFAGETFGRRQFYLASTLGMSIALIFAFISFTMQWRVVALISMYFFAFSFEFACGTLVWIVANELFPHYIRSIANALSVCMLFVCFFVVTFLLPMVETAIGFGNLFLIFAAFNLLALAFVYLYLPETQGVHLEQAYLLVDERFDTANELLCGSHHHPCGEGGDEDAKLAGDDDLEDDLSAVYSALPRSKRPSSANLVGMGDAAEEEGLYRARDPLLGARDV
jgi:major inositol transporter-like SP family MFS transporter